MKKVLPWLLGGIAFYFLFIKKGGLSSLFGGGAAAPATATPGNNSTTLIPGQPGASTILESFLGGNSGGLNAASAAGLGTAAGGLLTGLGNLLSGLGKGAAGLWDDVSSAASSVGNALGLTSPTNAAVDSGALNPNAIYSFPSLTASDQAALTAGDYTPYDPATGAGAADLVAADNSGPIALGNDTQNVPAASDFSTGETLDGYTDLGTFEGGGDFSSPVVIGGGNFVPTGSVAASPADNFSEPLIGAGVTGGGQLEGVDDFGGSNVNFDSSGDVGDYTDTEFA